MNKLSILLTILILLGCSTVSQYGTSAVEGVTVVEHQKYQVAELLMCRGISIGEWMRSIGSDREKALGWSKLCISSTIPEAPGVNLPTTGTSE